MFYADLSFTFLTEERILPYAFGSIIIHRYEIFFWESVSASCQNTQLLILHILDYGFVECDLLSGKPEDDASVSYESEI